MHITNTQKGRYVCRPDHRIFLLRYTEQALASCLLAQQMSDMPYAHAFPIVPMPFQKES